MIRAIAAIDDRNGIAVTSEQRTIPWNIPEDVEQFRAHTKNSVVLMGANTYQTLPQPLPDRRNIVVTRQLSEVRPGFELANDLEELIGQSQNMDMWVIGGAELFKTALKHCQELYLTHVSGDYHCDRFFPDYTQEFVLQSATPRQVSGQYTYRYAVYNRAT